MTEHTPGPWQRSGVRVKLGGEDCIAVGPDGFSVAFFPIGNRPQDQAGAIADARLASAAPEMLAALRKAHELFQLMSNNGTFDDLGIHPDTINEAVDSVGAAISKAKAP